MEKYFLNALKYDQRNSLEKTSLHSLKTTFQRSDAPKKYHLHNTMFLESLCGEWDFEKKQYGLGKIDPMTRMMVFVCESKSQPSISFFRQLTVYLEADSLRDWVSNLHHAVGIIINREMIMSISISISERPCWPPRKCNLHDLEDRPSKGPRSHCAKP